ncbi:hypothetical protein OG894_31310 [Streptomyces sp. NBC_01724]|uniref:hypothetical protein n=1 Tax=Streptomyces sp. NBC_01724 TaxID=2975922 RepID=UPI002E34B788|nr:hypothetical protein [Streptomyces sp. NBC_01724]
MPLGRYDGRRPVTRRTSTTALRRAGIEASGHPLIRLPCSPEALPPARIVRPNHRRSAGAAIAPVPPVLAGYTAARRLSAGE